MLPIFEKILQGLKNKLITLSLAYAHHAINCEIKIKREKKKKKKKYWCFTSVYT